MCCSGRPSRTTVVRRGPLERRTLQPVLLSPPCPVASRGPEDQWSKRTGPVQVHLRAASAADPACHQQFRAWGQLGGQRSAVGGRLQRLSDQPSRRVGAGVGDVLGGEPVTAAGPTLLHLNVVGHCGRLADDASCCAGRCRRTVERTGACRCRRARLHVPADSPVVAGCAHCSDGVRHSRRQRRLRRRGIGWTAVNPGTHDSAASGCGCAAQPFGRQPSVGEPQPPAVPAETVSYLTCHT